MTVEKAEVTLDPPQGLDVDTTPMFDPARTDHHGCIEEAAECHDQGHECGNLCEIWWAESQSCTQLADMFQLSMSRFEALNDELDCDKAVKQGTTVCCGGTCGD